MRHCIVTAIVIRSHCYLDMQTLRLALYLPLKILSVTVWHCWNVGYVRKERGSQQWGGVGRLNAITGTHNQYNRLQATLPILATITGFFVGVQPVQPVVSSLHFVTSCYIFTCLLHVSWPFDWLTPVNQIDIRIIWYETCPPEWLGFTMISAVRMF